MKRIISILLLSFIAFNVFAQDTTAPKGRPIDSIRIWKNGVVYFADDINVVCVYDDLNTSAKFYYELKDDAGEVVTNGNVTIEGQRYKNYSTLPNHADRAVVMVMQELKLQARQAKTATTAARAATTTTTSKQ